MFLGFVKILSLVYALFATQAAFAQAAPFEFVTSWRAHSYAPPMYVGKILPTANTRVTASFTLLEKHASVDTSKTMVRWFLNDQFLTSGIGAQSVTFTTDDLTLSGALTLKVFIPRFRGKEDLIRFIDIPIVRPELVIRAPYIGGNINAGNHTFEALPYFWNINSTSDLLIRWVAGNDQSPEGRGQGAITLTIPQPRRPTPLTISLSAKHATNEFEVGSASVELLIAE